MHVHQWWRYAVTRKQGLAGLWGISASGKPHRYREGVL
jgi:hypothetical protein